MPDARSRRLSSTVVSILFRMPKNATAPKRARVTASTAEYQTVSFTRIGNGFMSLVPANRIADASYGVDQFLSEAKINLTSQQADKGVEGIFFDFLIEPPNSLDDGAPGHHSARTPDEEVEQPIFRWRKVYLLIAATHLAGCRI